MSALSEELEQLLQQKDAIEAREAEIYRLSLSAPEAEKVCDDWAAKLMANSLSRDGRNGTLGWRVDAVSWIADRTWYERSLRGASKFVSVRPCAKEHEGKTFLGVLVGSIATSVYAHYSAESRVINIAPASHKPAIFVPALGEIIMGHSSWWAVIESEDQLRKITTEDIDGIWYVQAMKAMLGKEKDHGQDQDQ